MDPHHAKLAVAAAVATLVALWASLPLTVSCLLALMAVDLATGVVAGWMGQALSSDIGRKGLGKKVLILLGIAAVATLQMPFGDSVPAAAAVAGFYCSTEAISIAENLGRAGVPIPAPLRAALAALNRQHQQGVDDASDARPVRPAA
jgi:toxin secretion/phage lysis holin